MVIFHSYVSLPEGIVILPLDVFIDLEPNHDTMANAEHPEGVLI
jgi:hypothetical protein